MTDLASRDQQMILQALTHLAGSWRQMSEDTDPAAIADDGTTLRGQYQALAREAEHLAALLLDMPLPAARSCSGHSHACLELAFSWLLTAHDDAHCRGYLKEAPELVAYRLGLIEPLLACVRAKCQAELSVDAETEPDGYSPDADHHDEVAGFLDHSCNCDWCPAGRQDVVDAADFADDNPVNSLLRALDALDETGLHRVSTQMGEMARRPGPLGDIYAAVAQVAGFVLSLRTPEAGAELN